MNNIQKKVQVFLVIGFIAWAFRMAIIYNAQIDAIGMLALSLLIYNTKN